MSVSDQIGGPAAPGPLPGTGVRFGGLRQGAAHFALLPLRLFLGVTFLYAGVDTFTSWGPFSDAMSHQSMEVMLEFSRSTAAAPWLVDLALDHPGLFLNGVAAAEITAGLLVLAGLLTRLGAAVGALLSLSFWLTVTWTSEPYYFGQDLPYLAGFVTLLLAGGGPLSLDRRLATRRHRTGRLLFGP
ncbi:DoxX family protein [Streptomyces sp. ACA25]|uniref:DoxX family protein n=1 Tax=Streptomyces sp. ACA25 TaxID=3022596 RepID=UPI0023080A62|nr:DoxX family protein [Streptomyces sp. ACA25]MDB1087388.1 DoxX family protein [Streptomyces sp. ACA25]